jgi:hypothetical protein
MAGGVSPLQIYQALLKAGASTVQAIGVMANMINESDLNVETGAGGTAIDSNGFPVYGLVSWNTSSYPSASQLVTGNPAADLTAQANFLKSTGAFSAASGATGSEAAGNFAANYERCEGCQPGGSQYNSRVGNATTIAQWITSGNWPKSAGSSGSGATPAAGGTGPGCLMANPFSANLPLIGNVSAGPSCLFSTSQARALIGGLLFAPALILGITGAVLIVALGFRRVAPAAGGAAEAVGGGLALVPGLEGAGAAVAVAGHQTRRAGQSSRQLAQDRANARRQRRAGAAEDAAVLVGTGATRVNRSGRTVPADIPRSRTPNRPGRVTSSRPAPSRAGARERDQPPF